MGVGQCVVRSWGGYAIFHMQGIKPSRMQSDMEAQLQKIVQAVDRDGDEKITVDEARAYLEQSPSMRQQVREHATDHQKLFYQFKAEDTVAYHDMDNDMTVTRQELWDSLVQWNVVRIRIREGLKLVNAADRKGLEALERSLDYMRRSPVEFPKKLRPELEQLFSLPKGTKVFKSMKGVNSLSDQEFFSEARDRIEALVRKMGGKKHRREEM